MATAVETGSEPRKTPSRPMSLPVASLLGAVYVFATLAVVFYAVPLFWAQYVGPTENSFPRLMARVTLQVLALVGLGWFGLKLAGDAPPKGVRGGVFLMLVAGAVIFLVWRWAALNMQGLPGLVVSSLIAAFLLYLAVRLFTGRTGARWMVALEEQGWFHWTTYKGSLGQKVRRLTILGILLVGGSGVYSLLFQGTLPENWVLAMPFELSPVTAIPDARFVVPLVLMGLTLWVAWRAVNVPTFAEFLIATEAEMNKVSWTPKKRLAQDTVVVLTTTVILTLFLLVVDLFWGWLLSRSIVGVLPPPANAKDKGGPGEQAKW